MRSTIESWSRKIPHFHTQSRNSFARASRPALLPAQISKHSFFTFGSSLFGRWGRLFIKGRGKPGQIPRRNIGALCGMYQCQGGRRSQEKEDTSPLSVKQDPGLGCLFVTRHENVIGCFPGDLIRSWRTTLLNIFSLALRFGQWSNSHN